MFLKDLLENDHPLFTLNIGQMEKATGNAGVDTRLLADITHTAHDIMRALGLDPADTTSEELYHALVAAVKAGQVETLLSMSDFVLVNLGDGPISFNLYDAIENAHHQLPLANRSTGHAKRALRLEIVKRYAEHDRTHNDLIHELAKEIGLKQPDDEAYPKLKSRPASMPSILAVGDIFADAFIQLREDQARVDTDADGNKRLSMEFGTKIPYEDVEVVDAVGPSPNAAVAFARLGLKASLMAFLGDDLPGKDNLKYLAKEGVDTRLVAVQKGMKSNYYYVLRYRADRTILIKNEAYDYIWTDPEQAPDWLYLSMISESAWQLHEDMLTYLDKYPEVKLAFQPGAFHFKWGVEKLARVYKRSYIIVLNREEAAVVTGKPPHSIADLANALHDLGPEIVIITDGADGAYASYNDKLIKMPNYPDPAPPFDRTGAGDAFASTVVAALAIGEPLETALRWAPINSMSVVQKLGAQAGLLHKPEIEAYLKKAPATYTAEELA